MAAGRCREDDRGASGSGGGTVDPAAPEAMSARIEPEFMAKLKLPTRIQTPKVKTGTVQLIASGDLRLSANQVCWPAQLAMEQDLTRAIETEGHRVHRVHPYKEPA
jgi:hypothetical protein